MDPRKYMIVDLKHLGERNYRKCFKTKEVENFTDEGIVFQVKFANSSTPYPYKKSSLLILQNPEEIDLSQVSVYRNGVRVLEGTPVYRFSHGEESFWCIIDKVTDIRKRSTSDRDARDASVSSAHAEELVEEARSYTDKQVYVSRTSVDVLHPSLWSYFTHVAEEVGVENENGKVFLADQLQDIDMNRTDSPLANYLDPDKPFRTYPLPREVYYPFGCNQSQQQAVEKALTHQFSIIQGPPGTGKTQTILNIIANLNLANKKVLVVSNNNSAVDNIVEKLGSPKVGLDFMVARLGNSANKKEFISSQKDHPYPDGISGWYNESNKYVGETALHMIDKAGLYFRNQTRLAQLKLEQYDVELEQQYFLSENEVVSPHQWLLNRSSKVLLDLLEQYTRMAETGSRLSLFRRIVWAFRYGWRSFGFTQIPAGKALTSLRQLFYETRLRELSDEIHALEQELKDAKVGDLFKKMCEYSLEHWKSRVALSRKNKLDKERIYFQSPMDIKRRTSVFLDEYPIVLSTTQSSRNCIDKRFIYDYVIIDEASQVDIVSGLLAISCAANAVIVGDEKQLKNIVKEEVRVVLEEMEERNGIPESYRMSCKSFLTSCVELFPTALETLLREHYRCHPRIIEFCNKHFYDGKLIAMTQDHGEKDVLKAIRTAPGGTERILSNPREIEVIRREILPEWIDVNEDGEFQLPESLGFITPFKAQVNAINEAFRTDQCSTVHRFQGRECDSIVMSMVSNTYNDFIDNPDLINVAVSRAKNNFAVVLSGNEFPADSHIMQLIDYIRYNNFEVAQSKLRNVFDILYKPYTLQRLEYERTHLNRVSAYLSENLVYDLLKKVLPEFQQFVHADILCHYPLSLLVSKSEQLSAEELSFVNSPFSHVDFLVYNSVTKKVYFCVEVDGRSFHRNVVQEERDRQKDHVLELSGIALVRIATDEHLDEQVLVRKIKQSAACPTA